MPGRSLRYHVSICALVVGCTLASCGSKNDDAGQAEGNTPAATSTEAPATTDGGSTPAAASSDVCSLLTVEEANTILGMTVTREVADDKTCAFKPGAGNLLFGGVLISTMDETGVFDLMTEGGEAMPGMGDKALLNGSTFGVWKGSRGVVVNLINPPTDMNIKEVLTKIGEKVASRM